MEEFKNWLRKLGWVGNVIIWLGSALSMNWALVAAAIVGAYVATTNWAAAFFGAHNVQTGISVFLALLWTIIGLRWLADRKKPVRIARTAHLEWGLNIGGLQLGYDPENETAALQLSLIMTNSSGVALDWELEKFEVQIESRVVKLKKGDLKSGVLPFSMVARAFALQPFAKTVVQEFFGKRVTGTAEVDLVYGLVGGKKSRRLKTTWKCEFLLGVPSLFGPMIAIMPAIETEEDAPI